MAQQQFCEAWILPDVVQVQHDPVMKDMKTVLAVLWSRMSRK
jgi:hypothetical protein